MSYLLYFVQNLLFCVLLVSRIPHSFKHQDRLHLHLPEGCCLKSPNFCFQSELYISFPWSSGMQNAKTTALTPPSVPQHQVQSRLWGVICCLQAAPQEIKITQECTTTCTKGPRSPHFTQLTSAERAHIYLIWSLGSCSRIFLPQYEALWNGSHKPHKHFLPPSTYRDTQLTLG